MLTIEDAKFFVQNANGLGIRTYSGIDCVYYPCDGAGIKTYYDKSSRDYSYKLQKLASFHGFGPKCYGRFEYDDENSGYVYAYITEAVDRLLSDILPMEVRGSTWCAHLYHGNHPLHSFWKAMDDIGIRVYDSHHKNYGYLCGRLVCIDFGSPGKYVGYSSHRRTLVIDASEYNSMFNSKYDYSGFRI